jgi:dTDP-4-amino-4,6-dideoxygalactose transaminase
MDKLIPFYVPYIPEISKQYVLEVLQSNHQQGDGPFTSKASKIISGLVGGGYVLLTPSCTHALEMASMLLNLGPGDEVILPSYTFTSAAIAVAKFGATPVFVDIDMETKCIDVNQVREVITPRTRAISWVNYAGASPDIDGLQRLSREFNLFLIEDNAHGLGGSHKGKPLGSFGDFATQSFHATKNIQCGEGGALVVNNSKFLERAEIIREKGTDRSKFIRGEIQKYQWVDHGSSYLLAESLAAVLLGSLEEFTKIQFTRNTIWKAYKSNLSSWALGNNASLNSFSQGNNNSSHMFYVMTESKVFRDGMIEHLKSKGIQSTFHYQSLATSTMGSKYVKPGGAFVNSQNASSQLIRLPIYNDLNADDLQTVIESVLDFSI